MTAAGKQAEQNAKFEQGLSSLTQGVCVSVDWEHRLANINVGGAGGAIGIAMPMVTSAPYPGDAVWVAYLGAQPICLGIVPKPATGTTSGSAAGGRTTVIGDDGVTYSSLPYIGTAPSSGQRVVLNWPSNGTIIGVSSADQTGTPPEVPPTPGGGSGAQVFFPTSSATWRSGGWADAGFSVSDTRSGFYFYGTQMRDTIPAGSTVTGIGIDVSAIAAPSSAVTLTLHAAGSQPGSPPAAIDSFVVSQDSGYKTLPTAWGAAMKDGAAFGIGSVQASASGWMQWAGAPSGALSISWA